MASISLVVPAFNEAAAIRRFFTAVDRVADTLAGHEFEYVFGNDGSTDDTLACLLEASKSRPRLIVVDLARNFGKEAALTAGLQEATGDAVVPMDVDLQDPPEVIPRLVAEWEKGYEVGTEAASSAGDQVRRDGRPGDRLPHGLCRHRRRAEPLDAAHGQRRRVPVLDPGLLSRQHALEFFPAARRADLRALLAGVRDGISAIDRYRRRRPAGRPAVLAGHSGDCPERAAGQLSAAFGVDLPGEARASPAPSQGGLEPHPRKTRLSSNALPRGVTRQLPARASSLCLPDPV